MPKPKGVARLVQPRHPLRNVALAWHCPYYTRQGFASCCDTGDGHPTNCSGPAQLCTRVTDIFQTMAKIQKGEIEVY